MAEHNVKINVKTDTGYDQLYPKSKSDIIDFDKTSSNLSSTNVEAAIKEVNTKANTNKTNIGTLTSLTTNSKTNLVGAINEVDSHANTAQSTANTNKTNIGTLASLKTSVKTNIVNAINNLYDNTIGKKLTTLSSVEVATSAGYFVDALAMKELYVNKVKTTSYNLSDFHFQTFYNFSEWKAYSQNGMVYIYMSARINTSNFSANYLYNFNSSAIPSAIRPNYPIAVDITICDDDYKNPAKAILIFQTNGIIQIVSSVSSGNKWIKGSFSYPISVTHFS